MERTAVAERTEEERLTGFSCLVDDEFVHVQAKGPADADEKNNENSELIIQGNAGDIGARRVEEVLGRSAGGLREEQRPKEGALCTITVGDPVKIAGATYCGKEELGDYDFLVFTKNGIKFWAFSRSTHFNSIDGKRL